MSISNIKITIATIFILIIYSAMLYFISATASLHDSYQPGIEKLQSLARPELIMLLTIMIGVYFKRYWVARLTLFTSQGALVICLLLVIFFALHNGSNSPWVPIEKRTLSDTVKTALFKPTFSGRSTGRVIFNGALSAIGFGILLISYRKRYNKSFKPTPKSGAV